jgi:hypothetical protein
MASLMDREPAVTTGVLVTLFSAVISAAHAFDWIDWSPEESGAVAAVAVIILPVIQGLITRRWVRPAALSVPAPAPASGTVVPPPDQTVL